MITDKLKIIHYNIVNSPVIVLVKITGIVMKLTLELKPSLLSMIPIMMTLLLLKTPWMLNIAVS